MIFFPPSDSDDALELDELHSPVLFHIMKSPIENKKTVTQGKGKDSKLKNQNHKLELNKLDNQFLMRTYMAMIALIYIRSRRPCL